jgi:hypothetical protein
MRSPWKNCLLACQVAEVSASAPVASANDQLDAAIRETSDYLNAHLSKGNKLAILNIESAYPAFSEYVIDELIVNTVNDKVFTVVDRQQLDAIRAELDFHLLSRHRRLPLPRRKTRSSQKLSYNIQPRHRMAATHAQ